MKDLESHLRGCSVRQLIVAMRLMRSDKDTIGFDYSKVRKDELVERAVSLAGGMSADRRDKVSNMMEKAFGWEAADISAKPSAVGGSGAGTDADKKKKGFAAIDDFASSSYGSADEQHGPAQGGSSKEGGKMDADSKEKTEKAIKALNDAASAAMEKAIKGALEKQASQHQKETDELMDRMSKTVFKIEVESDDEDEDGDDQSGEGEEGQEGDEPKDGKPSEKIASKGGKSKKTRTIEAGTPRHKVFQEVCQAVNKGLNVLLVGPAGCGKTHMAQDIANVLALPFKFTGAVSSEYKLLGFMTAQGTLVRTEYREAYEHGGLFLWDEMDASSAQALLSFNAGLSNGHQDFPDMVVQQHKSFRAVASANTYGNGADRMYIGRNQLDAASLDRFYVVNMDYDEQLEQALYGRDEWVLYVQGARRAMRELGGIRHVISMRAIQMGLKMKGSGIPRAQVEQACLWRHLQKDDVEKIQRAMEKSAVSETGARYKAEQAARLASYRSEVYIS